MIGWHLLLSLFALVFSAHSHANWKLVGWAGISIPLDKELNKPVRFDLRLLRSLQSDEVLPLAVRFMDGRFFGTELTGRFGRRLITALEKSNINAVIVGNRFFYSQEGEVTFPSDWGLREVVESTENLVPFKPLANEIMNNEIHVSGVGAAFDLVVMIRCEPEVSYTDCREIRSSLAENPTQLELSIPGNEADRAAQVIKIVIHEGDHTEWFSDGTLRLARKELDPVINGGEPILRVKAPPATCQVEVRAF